MATVILDFVPAPRAAEKDNALLAVIVALGAIFIASNKLLPALFPGGWNLYVVQPVLWLALGMYCMSKSDGRVPAMSRTLLVVAVLCGAFQVAMSVLGGLLYGFGYSAYASGLPAISANLWYLGAMLFGAEMARSYMLGRLQHRPLLSFFAVAALFSLIHLSLGQLLALGEGGRGAIEIGGERVLPAFATSLLATLLSAAGGPWVAIAYRGVMLGTEWVSPVLPALPWLPAAVLGVLGPGLGFVAVQSILSPARAVPAEKPRSRLESPRRWLLAITLALAGAVWLNSGLLGVQPSIVSGISMEPALRAGDIVITRPVNPDTVRPGDVVRYRTGSIDVLHRVQEVRAGPAGRVFITRGDNNSYLDAPVPEQALRGRVVLVVPRLGLLPVKARELLGR